MSAIAEVAYTVATQTTRPSWGYMVSKGATTSWERWDTDIQDGGMNGESQKILSGNFEAWLLSDARGYQLRPRAPRVQAHHLAPAAGRRPDLCQGVAPVAVRADRERLEVRGRCICLDGDDSSEHDGDRLCAGEGCRGGHRRVSIGSERERGAIPEDGGRVGRLFCRIGGVRVSIHRVDRCAETESCAMNIPSSRGGMIRQASAIVRLQLGFASAGFLWLQGVLTAQKKGDWLCSDKDALANRDW